MIVAGKWLTLWFNCFLFFASKILQWMFLILLGWMFLVILCSCSWLLMGFSYIACRMMKESKGCGGIMINYLILTVFFFTFRIHPIWFAPSWFFSFKVQLQMKWYISKHIQAEAREKVINMQWFWDNLRKYIGFCYH